MCILDGSMVLGKVYNLVFVDIMGVGDCFNVGIIYGYLVG